MAVRERVRRKLDRKNRAKVTSRKNKVKGKEKRKGDVFKKQTKKT